MIVDLRASGGTSFLFSHKPLHDSPADPSGVTHRYARMCADTGIDSHLHACLGHDGGSATTLRVYAAWVGEADQKAADVLGSRMRPR
jgi:hypothetical protein